MYVCMCVYTHTHTYIHQIFELPDKLQCGVVQATTCTGYVVNKQTLTLGRGG